ncbi:arsenate reductase/protein-tyrosine-phosphatase family protein [Tautonia rosea]|uniref:arsenate reductase/protein-tyrosine-phosphatase family protein n=1 Tax=Tautonia rosea TaxID=2728037 RepID=UPI00147669A7|nr:Sua5/YciO/YrdC/YwlC family protein [Tautonia rosea]
MSDPNPSPELIELFRADDPRDVVHRAVASLARGGVIALPTETGYALAASALKPEAVARVAAAMQRLAEHDPEATGEVWLCVRGPGELTDWATEAPVEARRVASRAWPGPVVLRLADGVSSGLADRLPEGARTALVGSDATIALCCPEHAFVEHLTRLLAGPLVLGQPIGPQGETVRAVAGLLEPKGADLLIDDGAIDDPDGLSILAFKAGQMTVVRHGLLDDRTLGRLASTIILFVCTGNTCRSPMAEALFKAMLADRLGCHPEDLEAHGWLILSAGLSAMQGAPAAANAVEVVRKFGGSLEGHASRMLVPELVRAADRILVMTRSHLRILLEHAPEAADRTALLDPDGYDIDDPVGSDLSTYRSTAEAIRTHLAIWLDELIPPGAGQTPPEDIRDR